ncbi:MAG: helix-hairpin-helix domain-containing protein, partial [Thermodesulfobacteriota bacterium]
MKNAEVVNLFMEIADILDIIGESSFKSRAYRKAAQSIKNLSRDLSELDIALGTVVGSICSLGQLAGIESGHVG